MSDSTSRLPARPSLEQLRKQAKELLRNFQAGDVAAASRFRAAGVRPDNFAISEDAILADAQFVLAREYGFASWTNLVRHVESLPLEGRLDEYASLAEDLLKVYGSGDPEALSRLNVAYLSSFTIDVLRANVRKRMLINPESPVSDFTLADAQLFIAGLYGFDSWAKFAESVEEPAREAQSYPGGQSSSPPFFRIDRKNNAIEPRAPLSERDWDTIFGVMKEMRITGLIAGGTMTDSVMERLPELDHLTRLNFGGSAQLTDDGLMHLSRMPQLEDLDLSEYPGGRITDRGLEFLRHLPKLKRFQMCWQSGVSDAGVANLGFCENLESVDLLGTPTGDGVIRSLAGKPKLRRFKTGRFVTDAGLALLHQFPLFKKWHGGAPEYSLTSPDAEPNHLLLDGPFTNNGLANLAGLDGLFGLSFFWHISELTPDGLKMLADLPNLGFLGCGGQLCNDTAMKHIGGLPRLRMLMGQGSEASDDGFEALSRSQSIEYIWGRECPNLSGRGFTALARMPALKGLAVSCKNVDDAGLSSLPRFHALTEIMPMDVLDDGFRHIGRCEQLESLVLMYCKETTDVATEHIAGLPKLKKYFASYTKITDRSMEILGAMASLERISFYGCPGVTNAGVVALAGLPRLREVHVSGQHITRDCAAAFPAHVSLEIGS